MFRDHPPHLYYHHSFGSVQISLSYKAVNNDLQRDFQLAHEVCHLLYPSADTSSPITPQTNVLSEGISTLFSILVVEDAHGEDAADACTQSLLVHSPRYFFALKQVSFLLGTDRDAVKMIRRTNPMINDITEADLRASGLNISAETIAALAAKF